MNRRALTKTDPAPCLDPQMLQRGAQLVAAHKAFARCYKAAVAAGVIEHNGVIESSLTHIDEELIANVPETE